MLQTYVLEHVGENVRKGIQQIDVFTEVRCAFQPFTQINETHSVSIRPNGYLEDMLGGGGRVAESNIRLRPEDVGELVLRIMNELVLGSGALYAGEEILNSLRRIKPPAKPYSIQPRFQLSVHPRETESHGKQCEGQYPWHEMARRAVVRKMSDKEEVSDEKGEDQKRERASLDEDVEEGESLEVVRIDEEKNERKRPRGETQSLLNQRMTEKWELDDGHDDDEESQEHPCPFLIGTEPGRVLRHPLTGRRRGQIDNGRTIDPGDDKEPD